MRRTVFCGTLIAAVLLSAPTRLFASAITISIAPATQTVPLGSPVSLSVGVTGLGNQAAPSVGTFDLDLAFDPAILSFDSAIFGDPALGDELDPTGSGNTIAFDIPGAGTVELFDLSLDSAVDLNGLQAADFVLVRVLFDTVGTGTTSLSLSANALGDADGNPLDAVLEDGQASVTAVSATPEPSSLFLCGTVVMLAALTKGRFFRAATRRR